MVGNKTRAALALTIALCVACGAEPDPSPGGALSGTDSGASFGTADEGSQSSSGGMVQSGSGGGENAPVVYQRTGLVARLSKFEYENSIGDVLGVELLDAELDDSQGGIPDDTGDGVFKHLADNQTSVEQHALAYFRVAEAVAKRTDVSALVAQLGSCSEATEACGAAMIAALGRRLYRRPLDSREGDAMLGVFRAALDAGLQHEDATRWTLTALLQTPQFLFRMENETAGTAGAPRSLDGYELAARLASFLWVSVPDEALLDAAADGSLLTTDGLSTQVKRLLADPKAQRFTEVFATDFSRARFSAYEGATDDDRAALSESIIATFQDHFWNQEGGIADLFSTTRYVVNPTVAALLGLTLEGEGLKVVDVSGLPERVGLMSHPSMIAGMGDREIGSFVNRGKYLMERLLCRHPAAFPGDIATAIEEFNADTAGLNERERAEIRMTRPQCWRCHQQFEPLAFGFARFDAAGRYVGNLDPEGKPLPLDGWVPVPSGVQPQYTDVASYMQILAEDPFVQTCMTEHFLNFATSRYGDDAGRAEAERVGRVYLENGSTLFAMVSAVAQSELFRTILVSPPGTQP